MLRWQSVRHDYQPSEDSGYTAKSSWVDGKSISQNTEMQENIMKRLLQRQKTRRQVQKPKNLYDVVGDNLRPVMDMIDRDNPSQRRNTESGGEDDAEEENGGPVGGAGGRGNATNAEENGEDTTPAVPAEVSKWVRARSMKAVLALVNDPAKRNLVRQRTEAPQQKWQDLIHKVKADGKPGGMADVVRRAMKQKDEVSETCILRRLLFFCLVSINRVRFFL